MNVLVLKAKVRERDGMRCTECGMTNEESLARRGRSLDVHRLTPGSPYTVEGCVTLCARCHGSKPKTPRGAARPAWRAVPIPAPVHATLSDLARRSHRPLSWEVLLALENHLRARQGA